MNFENIPNKRARHLFVVEHLNHAGISRNKAQEIARLVPDMFLLHSVFLRPTSLHLEIVDSHHVFLKIGENTVYLGSLTISGHPVHAHGPWLEIYYQSMSEESAASIDVEGMLADYDRLRWLQTFDLHKQHKTLLSIDLTGALREFVGGA